MSSHMIILDCYGQACRNCGKCRDWKWIKGSNGFCCISGKEGRWKRHGKNCRYGENDIYHNTVRNGYHHSLCVCEGRLK